MDRVRVGIIGSSGWVEFMILGALKSHPGAEVAAICSRNREPLEAFAKKHGIPHAFTDYREMLSSGFLDAVVVASPDGQHKEQVTAAFGAGLHVLCEKPLSLTLADAEAMLKSAKASGKVHLVPYTWRWQPHFRYLKDLVAEGHFGRPLRAQFSFWGEWGLTPAYGWRYDADRSGGVLSDLGSHMMDLALWYLGDIRSLVAHAPVLIDRNGVEGKTWSQANDAALITLDFVSGAQGVIDVTNVSHRGNANVGWRVSIDGTDASIEVVHRWDGALKGVTVAGMRRGEEGLHAIVVPERYYEGGDRYDGSQIYWNQPVGTRLFIDSILAGTQPEPGIDAGVRVQRIIDAALRSHAERRWIDL